MQRRDLIFRKRHWSIFTQSGPLATRKNAIRIVLLLCTHVHGAPFTLVYEPEVRLTLQHPLAKFGFKGTLLKIVLVSRVVLIQRHPCRPFAAMLKGASGPPPSRVCGRIFLQARTFSSAAQERPLPPPAIPRAILTAPENEKSDRHFPRED